MSPSDLVPDFVTKTADSVHDQLRFGVDADEITSMAACWRAQGSAVADIELGALSAATGSESSVVAALHSAHSAASPTLASVATRLRTLGNHLRTFNDSTTAGDAAAAASLRSLAER